MSACRTSGLPTPQFRADHGLHGSWVLVPVPQRGLVLSNGAAFTNGSSRVSNALTINAVNLLHDPLGPLNRRSNQRFCSWTRLRIEEVFRRLQMAGHQYSCHD